MNKTFKIGFSLRNTYRVNSIIYSLKQIPLVKRILPEALYKNKGLKGFANVISILYEIFTCFVWKPLYVLLLIGLPLMLYPKDGRALDFLNIFMFLTLSGIVANTQLFNPTKDKFYAIVLMRMDAKGYALSNYIYFLAKGFIGLTPALIAGGIYFGLPWYSGLLLGLFFVFAKTSYSGFLMWLSKTKGKNYNENKPGAVGWTYILTMTALGYGLPFIGFAMPQLLMYIIIGASLVGFIFGARILANYDDYKSVYKSLLNQDNIIFSITAAQNKQIVETYNKQLDDKAEINTKKRGYGYFHDIFVKRHRKLLTKSAKKMTVVLLALLTAAVVGVLVNGKVAEGLNGVTLTYLPYFLFIMYFVNRGQAVTQAMFMNCDHSMLTYRFYRQPAAVLDLFTKRLKTVVMINLMPSSVIAIGLPLIMYLSGGTSNQLNYAVLFFSIIAMSVFFSVHHMVIYYLLQPYNAQIEMKSMAYKIVNYLTYLVAFWCIYLKLPTMVFGSVVIIVALIYVIVSLILAYRLAPKTFKLR